MWNDFRNCKRPTFTSPFTCPSIHPSCSTTWGLRTHAKHATVTHYSVPKIHQVRLFPGECLFGVCCFTLIDGSRQAVLSPQQASCHHPNHHPASRCSCPHLPQLRTHAHNAHERGGAQACVRCGARRGEHGAPRDAHTAALPCNTWRSCGSLAASCALGRGTGGASGGDGGEQLAARWHQLRQRTARRPASLGMCVSMCCMPPARSFKLR